MKLRKDILFIIPSMNGGGAERVLINLFKLIDLNQFNIHLYVIEEKGVLWESIPDGINKKLLFPNKYISKLATLLYRKFSFKGISKFYGKNIKGKYDVGVSFLDSIHTEFLFINKADIDKKVAMIHSSYKSYPQKLKLLENEKYKNKVLERYKNVDIILTVSHESLSEFIDIFGTFNDMRVIYNPINKIDVIAKANSFEPQEINSDKFTFIAIGSLIPVKGFDLLIDACKYLKDEGFEFEVNILGDGQLRSNLDNQIKKQSLTKHVFLRGFKENPYPWLKHSQTLIMTSIAEGLPTVLCEALTMGIPTITPNVPGCREVIEYGEYGLVYDRDSKALFNQMKKIIIEKEVHEKYSKKSIERSEVFNDKNVLKKYYELFNL
jgi:glycosyltransferase involved in cell wall biosynthesis